MTRTTSKKLFPIRGDIGSVNVGGFAIHQTGREVIVDDALLAKTLQGAYDGELRQGTDHELDAHGFSRTFEYRALDRGQFAPMLMGRAAYKLFERAIGTQLRVELA